MKRDEAFEVLGLSSGASKEEIVKAYRELSKKTHPDMGGTNYLFRVVNEAYTLLTQAPPTQQNQTSQKTTDTAQHKRGVTFRDIISDPDFHMTFEQYLEALRDGQSSVAFKGYRVNISRTDITYLNIACQDAVNIHVSYYKNIFRFLFRREDGHADTWSSTWHKNGFKQFVATGKIRFPHFGWYRITISKGDQKICLKYHGKKAQVETVEKAVLKYEVDDLAKVEINLWLRLRVH